MTQSVYTEYIAHHVELYRKRELERLLQDQNQEVLRKFTQMQLVQNKKKRKDKKLLLRNVRRRLTIEGDCGILIHS